MKGLRAAALGRKKREKKDLFLKLEIYKDPHICAFLKEI